MGNIFAPNWPHREPWKPRLPANETFFEPGLTPTQHSSLAQMSRRQRRIARWLGSTTPQHGIALASTLAFERLRAWVTTRTARWLPLLLLLSGGCATVPPPPIEIMEAPALTVPAVLLTCPDEPVAPDPEAATQRDVGIFLFDLSAAGAECRRKLRTVRELLATQE